MRLLRLAVLAGLSFGQAVLALFHYLVSHRFDEEALPFRVEPSEQALLTLHGLNAGYLFLVALGLLRPRGRRPQRPGWAARFGTGLLLLANLVYAVINMDLLYLALHDLAGGHRRRVLLSIGGQWLLTLPVLVVLTLALRRAARTTQQPDSAPQYPG